jgi:hypothetical protein
MSTDRTTKLPQPSHFEEQLAQELEAVEAARDAVNRAVNLEGHRTDPPPASQDRAGVAGTDKDALAQAHDSNLFGLAFSGGGIRSATFNLGVIQRLAQLRLLHRIDYLSTVSGGGYIGSWLSAWVHHAQGDTSDTGYPGVLAVEQELSRGASGPREPHEIRWLRRFSNYLTPRVGVLSSDTLSGVATYLRNLFLNQSILVAFGAAVLLLPWGLAAFTRDMEGSWISSGLSLAALLLLVGATLAGYETLRADLGRKAEAASEAADKRAQWRYRIVVTCFALTALLSGILISLNAADLRWQWAFLAGVYGAGTSLGWWAAVFNVKRLARQASPRKSWWLQPLWALLASAALGGMLILWGWLVSRPASPLANALSAVALGPVFVLGSLLLAVTLHLGLTSRGLREAGREFWSHHGGQQFRLGVAWLVLTGAALFGPLVLIMANNWVAALGGLTWVLTTLAGVLAGSGGATGGPGSSRAAELAARVAPYVFVAGLLLVLSYGVYRGIWGAWDMEDLLPGEGICQQQTSEDRTPVYDLVARLGDADATEAGGRSVSGTVYDATRRQECTVDSYVHESEKLISGHAGELFLLMLLLLVGSLGLSRRVDINVFGFHMFYRNRIERCYMGASNTGRRPHPATGLDPTDAPALKDLVLEEDSPWGQRPFPIVNAALNITSARNLAWQERKAASFTFTPMFCGYELEDPHAPKNQVPPCYQPTADYVKEEGKWISLGLPVTISGAAASPNAGYHTSAATAFLMTVFNVRLGWWLQNPRFAAPWQQPGPKLALFLLLEELAGMTTDKSKYVYLSDGGHFENLGIYELVRRRCRYVIACDAGCDPDYEFEDLGNAIRKCQIDLGIDIDIDPQALRPDPGTGRSTFHCAVGRIGYPDGPPGFLLYIKASLTGDEPADVLQYAAHSPDFPHQTTADQWYGESQFESYRKLGCHVVDEVLTDSVEVPGTDGSGATTDLEEVFNALGERWYRPSPHVEASFSKHGRALAEIFELIRNNENLQFLDEQIYPEWPDLMEAAGRENATTAPAMLPEDPEKVRAGFYLCNSLIQLMESVYLDLNLEQQYAHPDNRGWINLFRHWSWAGMLRVTWAISAGTYGARFQRFCRRRLDLPVGRVICSNEFTDDSAEGGGLPLNFVEKWHIRNVVKARRHGHAERLSIFQLFLEVGKPLEGHDEVEFSFPFGFALVGLSAGKRELVYYRVRDHLRGMGLGRKGLAILHEKHKLLYRLDILDARQQARVERLIPEADYAALKRLWDSVVKAADERGGGELDGVV